MKLLQGKTALITGAGRGIGMAIARTFAENGANVILIHVTPNKDVEAAVKEFEGMGVKAAEYLLDVSDYELTQKMTEEIVTSFGQIDILVNNAGITRDTLLMRMSEKQWDDVLNVNLKSAFNMTHAVIPHMARKRTGCIINMSSVVGESGNAGQCNYAASKAGLIGFTKSIAKEMGARGIRANCIAPGFIISDMTSALPEDLRNQFITTIPLRRAGQPEDVAKVALFLASDMASYVTGQVINCCGGMHI